MNCILQYCNVLQNIDFFFFKEVEGLLQILLVFQNTFFEAFACVSHCSYLSNN